MGAEVNLPDVTTGDAQAQPSPRGSVSGRRDAACESRRRAAGFLASPAGSGDRSLPQVFPAAVLPLACLGLPGLDSLTSDPGCHPSQY